VELHKFDANIFLHRLEGAPFLLRLLLLEVALCCSIAELLLLLLLLELALG